MHTMTETSAADIREKLDRLRMELVELAFTLDTRRQCEAAEVALTTSARVGELCDELESESRGPIAKSAP
jgi:hypothetical protein